jgi:ferric-dicitrate binding protein FerR (iron transport regulator)
MVPQETPEETPQDASEEVLQEASEDNHQPPEPMTASESSAESSSAWEALKARLVPLAARLKETPLFRTRRRTIVTLVIGVPLVLCLGSWLFGFVAFSDAARLVELKGLVQTRPEDETQWEPAHLNQLLWHKHRLRTGTESSARLRFFDVSTVDLEEETEVSVAQVAKRRGGNRIDVVLKVWLGKTAVRAVRFVDPSSTFRVDTPTASTVVRGARFTMQVDEDGTTQIDVEEGSAEVQINGDVVVLVMGERMTLDPNGLYEIEQIFEPDAQLVAQKITAAWESSGEAFEPELTENDVNQFLAAMSQQPDFFLEDTQIWFVDGEARAATTVVDPVRFDLSAAVNFKVVDGKLKPKIRAIAAGVALPVPGAVLNPALDVVLGQMEDYLDQAYEYVAFEDVQIEDGYVVVTGHKQPDAPVD